MSVALPTEASDHITGVLRAAGAGFALLFGSWARGEARPDSDIDVAAWWSHDPPNAWDVLFRWPVDLIIIRRSLPLELAGRIANEGVVLLDDDQSRRVEWVATTRKIWLDERYRFERSNREYLESVARGGSRAGSAPTTSTRRAA